MLNEPSLAIRVDAAGNAVAMAGGQQLRIACADAGDFTAARTLLAALGGCLAASMAPLLVRHGADMTTLHIALAVRDAALSSGVDVTITLPACETAVRTRCERAARHCPVLRALAIPVNLHWQTD